MFCAWRKCFATRTGYRLECDQHAVTDVDLGKSILNLKTSSSTSRRWSDGILFIASSTP
jgi:hypothetical protein